jgi:hypothetical protein
MLKVSVVFILLTTLQLAHAEYRTYRLQVTKDDKPVREVVATLDHVQYPEYYPLNANEKIEYVESWMCWGRTEAFEPPCTNPNADRQPANQPEQKSEPNR